MLLALLATLALLRQEDSPEIAARAPERFNVVFILADDLGFKDVGFQGSAYATPNLDRLAAEGVVFSHAYAASPMCSPTRAAILTGEHPARLGITRAIRNSDYLAARPDAEPPGESRARFLQPPSATHLADGQRTIAARFLAAGWRTGFVGKWHLGEAPYLPEHHGFEVQRAVGSASASPYFVPFRLRDLGIKPPAPYLTDHLTEEALLFLRERRDEPFFLFLAHYAVHAPLEAKPELVRHWRRALARGTPQSNPTYAAMIESLDQSVGRILDELDRLELAEETLVVFTSDNGPTLVSADPITTVAPLRGGKLDLYEGGVRVPLVVRWKGRFAPARRDEIVTSMDFYPTLLALAGLERASDEAPDGVDVSALLGGGLAAERGPLHFHVPHGEPRSAIVERSTKLIHFFDGRNELYDLAADPGEAQDLSASRPERARELEAELLRWLSAVGAGMPRENPAYDPDAPAEPKDG